MGGMGVVYQAWDNERKVAIALKTLRDLDAGAIYRFKREFRAIADLVHPNLVVLHELVSESGEWFFTMELVDGVDFLRWVRPGSETHRDPTTPPTLPILGKSTVEAREPKAPLDERRLRDAMLQLAKGLSALHAAGRLHRDIKPGNVLVTPEGRVVLLDFGLATDLERPMTQSSDQVLVGTVGYMAPEQAAMLPCTEAADWYAVGTMLYEALTGRLPFTGSYLQVLMDKQKFEPAPPASVTPGAPADLSALCAALLRTRPEDRPAGQEVLRRLGVGSELETARALPRSISGALEIVGREEPLQSLLSAFAVARQVRPIAAFVHGRPGAGTSSLLRSFLDRVQGECVVLAGRCYERESVPFKALDSLIDSLSRYLARLPRLEAEALLPRDVAALARMFPVLRRVEAIAGASRRNDQAPDVRELRKRAANSLRELFARMADRRPLVLAIDSVQWGDADSAALIAELVRSPDAPAMLLLVGYRSEDAQTSAPLRELRAALEGACEVREVEVAPLLLAEARKLALALLERTGQPAAHADAVAHESGGNPFFVFELVRYLQIAPGGAYSALDDVIRARVAQLPAPARRVLEMVAVAGRPLLPSIAARAAGAEADERSSIALLRLAHLLRSAGDEKRVETYHDQIRHAVVAGLPSDRLAGCHLLLARAIEQSGATEAEALAFHYRSAGLPERAAEHLLVAAARAAEALAFDRAVRQYKLALHLRPPEARWGRDLEVRLGDALANAGRGAEAAAVYLRTAARPGIEAAEALNLRRCAAEQYLRSGHVDEGLETLRTVLASVGMRLVATPRGTLLSLLLRRVQVRLRGLSYRPRDPSQVSPENLTLIDVCYSGALGLAMIDALRGSAFQARHLLLALEAGEPKRIALALAAEAGFLATSGGRAARRGAKLLDRAAQLADRIEYPYGQAMVAFMGALTAFLGGRWRRARELAERAEAIFRDRCTGVAWEVGNSQLFSLWSLFYLGELGELSRRVAVHLREAQQRGDIFAAASFRTGVTSAASLLRDDVEGARGEVRQVLDQWSHQGFHFQHYWGLLAEGIIDLYNGDGRRAWERIHDRWHELDGALLLRIQQLRVEATHLRARSALAALGSGLDDRMLLRSAARDARALAAEDVSWAPVVSLVLRAAIAAVRGEPAAAIPLLERAAPRFDELDMALFAAAARRRLGKLLGGDRGAELVAAADASMAAQGVVNVERMTAMLAPPMGSI